MLQVYAAWLACVKHLSMQQPLPSDAVSSLLSKLVTQLTRNETYDQVVLFCFTFSYA